MLYKHRIVHAVEAMITDILALANPTFCYRGADGKPISLTEAAVAQDCASYVLLNDTIVEQIYTSMQPGLVRARPHLERAPQPPVGRYSAPPRPAPHLRRTSAATAHLLVVVSGPVRCRQDEARELVRRLKARDLYQQVGESVKMRMRPCCRKCGRDTDISDDGCRKCLTPTEDRAKVEVLDKATGKPRCDAEGKPLYQSEHASLSEAAVRDELLRLCEPRLTPEQAAAFYVSFVEIFHGKAAPECDPWGFTWVSHHPLTRVGFYNPKQDPLEEEPHKLNNKALVYLPRDDPGFQEVNLQVGYAQRTLMCFMKHEDALAGRIIEAALKRWCKQHHAPPQQGSSNPMASPCTPQRRQARRVGNATRPMQSLT